MRRSQGTLLLLLFVSISSFCQRPVINFGKISAADFKVSSPLADSNANAVVLADIGSTEFIGNSNGDFTLVFKEHKRIWLRDRKAFDAATIHVPVYNGTNYLTQEKFEDWQASTYNLENGQVVETKLGKDAVFTEKVNKEMSDRKFTFPNLKEGSIIEYVYTVKSPFYSRLRSWHFQGEYPCLWSEYRVTIPPMFNYFATHHGFLKYTIDSASKVFRNYIILDPGNEAYGSTRTYRISGDARFALWAIKDVPAIKTENYVSATKNYVSRVQFLLKSIKYSESETKMIMKDWFGTAADLLKDPEFGEGIMDNNGWLDDVKKLVAKEIDRTAAAKKIYEYVRDNFNCTDHEAWYLSQSLKKTFQSKTGNVADINMLLTAILINNGFEAQPVILSTRDNGFANEATPVLNEYNYLLARVKLDESYRLLDASHTRLGFGKIPEDCYNHSGRVIAEMPTLVPLLPDSLVEEKRSSFFVVNNDKGGLEGAFSTFLGNTGSYNFREKMAKMKKDDLQKEVSKEMNEFQVSEFEIDSLKMYDEPVNLHYMVNFKFDEDVVYFNPMMGEGMKKNPFTSAERFYPVEMPHTFNETYILDMEIPKGYVVDEIPKSVRFKLNDNEGMFEYIVGKSAEKLQMRCITRLNKATFSQEDYESLREFFSMVIKKEGEQIVFKKAK